MADVGFEPVRMRRRRLALRCTSSLPSHEQHMNYISGMTEKTSRYHYRGKMYSS